MGATASGKSELALRAAQRYDGEIITADSMQVYKGLDIGTAKPTEQERRLVPHHLIDILDIHEPLDVFKYVELAENKIREIYGRGKLPIVAGGSGLYLRALIYGLDPLPADENLKKRLENEFPGDKGFEKLKAFMKENDPEDYARWHSHQRKLMRALEVFRLTGNSITALQKVWKEQPRYPVVSLLLDWDRDALKERIRQRTAVMLSSGWLEEARGMIDRGVLETPTARQVIGYSIINEYFKGEINFQKMEDRIAVSTWQLARRQLTWFKSKHPEAEKVHMPCRKTTILEMLDKSLQ